MTEARDVLARTAVNRRVLADFFDSLDEAQLTSRSLCEAWTVREVLGHVVMPVAVGLGELAGPGVDRFRERG